jgi:hypothetical protein
VSINDIEEYWKQAYGQPLIGSFTPVEELVSYDSNSPDSPLVCGNRTSPTALKRSPTLETSWAASAALPQPRRHSPHSRPAKCECVADRLSNSRRRKVINCDI